MITHFFRIIFASLPWCTHKTVKSCQKPLKVVKTYQAYLDKVVRKFTTSNHCIGPFHSPPKGYSIAYDNLSKKIGKIGKTAMVYFLPWYSRIQIFCKYDTGCIRILASLGFPSVSVSVHTRWQVKHQHCSRTWRVQKNHNIFRKKHNI